MWKIFENQKNRNIYNEMWNNTRKCGNVQRKYGIIHENVENNKKLEIMK